MIETHIFLSVSKMEIFKALDYLIDHFKTSTRILRRHKIRIIKPEVMPPTENHNNQKILGPRESEKHSQDLILGGFAEEETPARNPSLFRRAPFKPNEWRLSEHRSRLHLNRRLRLTTA